MLLLVCTMLLGQTPQSAPLAPMALRQKAIEATVRVYNAQKNGSGTAVAIGRDGPVVYLLSAAHLARGVDQLDVHVFAPGEGARPKHVFTKVAVLATADEQMQDLALLRLVDSDRVIASVLPLPKKAAARPKLPFDGFTAGCTDAAAPTLDAVRVLQAVLVRKPGADEAVRCFKCKSPATAGRSGGPLLDADGLLLGIASGGDSMASYYIHLDEIRPFLKRNGVGFLAE
jgi:hypothetical protein